MSIKILYQLAKNKIKDKNFFEKTNEKMCIRYEGFNYIDKDCVFLRVKDSPLHFIHLDNNGRYVIRRGHRGAAAFRERYAKQLLENEVEWADIYEAVSVFEILTPDFTFN